MRGHRDYIKSTSISIRESQHLRRVDALQKQREERLNRQLANRSLSWILSDSKDLDSDDTKVTNLVPQTNGHKRKHADEESDDDVQMLDTADPGQHLSEIPYTEKPTKNKWKDQIMIAEWLNEIPPDLAEKFVVCLCPKGKRCLAISGRRKTVLRKRSGAIIQVFDSALPHGASWSGTGSIDLTVLDCIYDQANGVVWILDLISWNGHPYFDCETDFRLFWISQKMRDIDQVKYYPKFQLINFSPAHLSNILELMKYEECNPAIDGLLFYHREAHYTPGLTPLCGWVGIEKWPVFRQLLHDLSGNSSTIMDL